MRLHSRLALPLVLTALGVMLAGVAGVTALVRRTTDAALDQERAQFQRIVENTLRQRTENLTEVTAILVSLDGPVGRRLGEWRHVPVDAAAILAGSSGAVRSAAGPDLDAADAAAVRAVASADPSAIRLVRARDGSLLLAAAARDRRRHEIAVVAQRLDEALARTLAGLLQADVDIALAGRTVATTLAGQPPATDSLPVQLELATTAGAPVVIRLHVPAAGIARARREALAFAAGGGLLLLVLAGLFYAWSVRRVTDPIRELIAATDRIAAGRLDAALPPGAPAELGALVGQFNTMAAALREARSRLAQSAALGSVGQLVAGISHELNNPLSGLLTHAEYAAGRLRPGDPGQAELLVILEEGRRLKRILQDLRGLIRPTEATRVRVDLNLVAQDVLQFIRHDATHASVQCEAALTPAGAPVTASPDQLRQVVLNLALNALQAMPRGGRLTLSTRRDDPTPGRVRLLVEDTGTGIAPDLLPRLTEPFFTTTPGRLGLGLAICDEILRAHGGSLAIASKPNQGTSVTLDLPVAA